MIIVTGNLVALGPSFYVVFTSLPVTIIIIEVEVKTT